MNDHIKISGITAEGFHGVFPEERRTGQTFSVDVVLYFNLAPAGATDELMLTVDYGAVSQLVVEHIQGEPVNLIERVATLIADDILAKFELVDLVEVTVHKPFAPVGVSVTDISVSIERTR